MVGPLSLSENNKIVFKKYECILGPWSKILLQPHFCCKIISRFSTLDIHLLKIIYHQFLLLMIAAACLYLCLYMEQDRSQRYSSRSCCIILPTQEHKPINLNMNLSRPQNNISISPVWGVQMQRVGAVVNCHVNSAPFLHGTSPQLHADLAAGVQRDSVTHSVTRDTSLQIRSQRNVTILITYSSQCILPPLERNRYHVSILMYSLTRSLTADIFGQIIVIFPM